MTRADNQANYRTRKKKQGLVRVEVWVPRSDKRKIMDVANAFCGLHELLMDTFHLSTDKPSTTGDKDPET